MKRDDLMASDECEGACNEEGNCSGYEFIEGENCTLFFGKMIPDAGRNLRKRSRRLMPPSINHFCKRKENSELSASALHFSCISGGKSRTILIFHVLLHSHHTSFSNT